MTLLQDNMNYWCGCFSFSSLSITLYIFPGHYISEGVAVVQLLSRAQLFAIQTIACQTPLSFIISQSLLRFMSIESVMLSNTSFSVAPFSSCPQSFPSSGFFPVSWLFASGGQSIGTYCEARGFINVLISSFIIPMMKEQKLRESKQLTQRHAANS